MRLIDIRVEQDSAWALLYCILSGIDEKYTVLYNRFMIEVLRTEEFARWIRRLKDADARARINLMIRRLALTENFGDAKSVGDGVFEMRLDYGPGYRLYYARRGAEIILLLIGGDKSTQQKDIAKAKKINLEYE